MLSLLEALVTLVVQAPTNLKYQLLKEEEAADLV